MLSFIRTTLSIMLLVSMLLSVAVNALSGAILRHNDMMASMGLLPDGTPMHDAILEEDWWEEVSELKRRQAVNTTVELIQTEYVELPIDHFGDGQGTFKNRYWVAEGGYKPGGP